MFFYSKLECCCIKEYDKKYDYVYDYDVEYDPFRYMIEGNFCCIICKSKIDSPYVSVFRCNYCYIILGHSTCILKWSEDNETCPFCKK